MNSSHRAVIALATVNSSEVGTSNGTDICDRGDESIRGQVRESFES